MTGTSLAPDRAATVGATPAWTAAVGAGPDRAAACERLADGVLGEPVAALTSLAFVVGALVVVVAARRVGPTRGARPSGGQPVRGPVTVYAALVAGIGVGSAVAHGPAPAWSDPVHDLPLLATLAYVAADAAADLSVRRRPVPRAGGWRPAAPRPPVRRPVAGPPTVPDRAAPPPGLVALVVVALLAPVVVLAPRAGDLAQAVVAGVAVAGTLARAAARPALRARIGVALALLVTGAVVGTLSRAGWPWCDPASPWQGHGVWHVLAATALVVLAPVVGQRAGPDVTGPTPPRRHGAATRGRP